MNLPWKHALGVAAFLFLVSVSNGQNNPAGDPKIAKDSVTRFRLVFSTYNHAERIMKGTTIYVLTESSIKVFTFMEDSVNT